MPLSDKPQPRNSEETRSSDGLRESRAPRKARPRVSLKMQAIGFLSRREHSRQELRAKLLEALRKRARDEAALAAASDKAARQLAEALREQPSNGIDDAFAPQASSGAPRAQARAPDSTRTSARTDGTACHAREPEARADAVSNAGNGKPGALQALGLADGRPLPAALQARLATSAPLVFGPVPPPARAGAVQVDPASDPALEDTDPEVAVDQLLDWLAANNYLSEARFVESRVNARSRKQGTLRIKLELSRHGLTLEPEQADALRATEFARAQALWQRKFGAVASEPRERAKQARFLASRGFAADVVRRIVGGLDED
jgi:regulatory protein